MNCWSVNVPFLHKDYIGDRVLGENLVQLGLVALYDVRTGIRTALTAVRIT